MKQIFHQFKMFLHVICSKDMQRLRAVGVKEFGSTLPLEIAPVNDHKGMPSLCKEILVEVHFVEILSRVPGVWPYYNLHIWY